jgi:hypothetical protein
VSVIQAAIGLDPLHLDDYTIELDPPQELPAMTLWSTWSLGILHPAAQLLGLASLLLLLQPPLFRLGGRFRRLSPLASLECVAQQRLETSDNFLFVA